MKDLHSYSERKESFCHCITLICFLVLLIDCQHLHLERWESSLSVKHWAEALPLAGQEGGCRMSALLYHGVQNSEDFGLSSNNHSVNDYVFACPL